MSVQQKIHAAWPDLLVEPKSILGAYSGKAPALSTFAPHSFRADFNDVAVAGQFLELPSAVPHSWYSDGVPRAYAAFKFLNVRSLNIQGCLATTEADDSLHGLPVGAVGECTLQELEDVVVAGVNGEKRTYWRKFTFRSTGFLLELEASDIMLDCGTRAHRQAGWPETS